MFPSSFRSYGPGRRKDSAIRTLVAETLVLAKTHGCVEKIESELEEELRRESGGQASDPLSKWRRKGDKALKSKYALLTVALFCVTDCALVLGELILDLHRVKDTLETTERTMEEFKETLHTTYPAYIPDVTIDISDVFDLITRSRILWVNASSTPEHRSNVTFPNGTLLFHAPLPPGSLRSVGGHLETGGLLTSSSSTTTTTTARSMISVRRRRSRAKGVEEETEYIVVVQEEATSEKRTVNDSSAQAHGTGAHGKGKPRLHSLEEDIAHAFHLTSVTLLAILMFESLLKAFCAGLSFFKRKLETFDLFIVVVSFLVDVVFMQILPRFKIQDFVFILAFLLPWRVIRVVNSLVVAVQDHEHFRLKMVYSRKKKIQNSLRETEVKLQLFRAQCCALKRLCLSEGVEECKIEEIVQLDEYVVNRTGKSKCKVKIDNTSVILLDKSDFPPGPRWSQHPPRDKRLGLKPAGDSSKEPSSSDKAGAKRNGHKQGLTAEDGKWRGMGRRLSLSISNGPLGSLFGPSRTLAAVPEDGEGGNGDGRPMVRRTSSQGQICAAIKRDLMLSRCTGAEEIGQRKSEGEHELASVVTADGEVGGGNSSAAGVAVGREELPAENGSPSGASLAVPWRVPQSVSLQDNVSTAGRSLAETGSAVDGGVPQSASFSSQLGHDNRLASDSLEHSGDVAGQRSPMDPCPAANGSAVLNIEAENSVSNHLGQLVSGNTSYTGHDGGTVPNGNVVPNGNTVPSIPFHVIENAADPSASHARHEDLPDPHCVARSVVDSMCVDKSQELMPAVLDVSHAHVVPAGGTPRPLQEGVDDDGVQDVTVDTSPASGWTVEGYPFPEHLSTVLEMPEVSEANTCLSDRLPVDALMDEAQDIDGALMTPTNDYSVCEGSAHAELDIGHAELGSDKAAHRLNEDEKSEADTEQTSSTSQEKTSESETVSTICDSLLSLPTLDDSPLVLATSETATAECD